VKLTTLSFSEEGDDVTYTAERPQIADMDIEQLAQQMAQQAFDKYTQERPAMGAGQGPGRGPSLEEETRFIGAVLKFAGEKLLPIALNEASKWLSSQRSTRGVGLPADPGADDRGLFSFAKEALKKVIPVAAHLAKEFLGSRDRAIDDDTTKRIAFLIPLAAAFAGAAGAEVGKAIMGRSFNLDDQADARGLSDFFTNFCKDCFGRPDVLAGVRDVLQSERGSTPSQPGGTW
jgi:hypothetical protein